MLSDGTVHLYTLRPRHSEEKGVFPSFSRFFSSLFCIILFTFIFNMFDYSVAEYKRRGVDVSPDSTADWRDDSQPLFPWLFISEWLSSTRFVLGCDGERESSQPTQ